MASICSSSFRRMYILSMAGFMSLRGAAGVHLAAHLNAHLGDDPLLHVGVQIGQTRLMGHDVRPLPAQLQNSAEDLGGILLQMMPCSFSISTCAR